MITAERANFIIGRLALGEEPDPSDDEERKFIEQARKGQKEIEDGGFQLRLAPE